jgi:hypothetical protein
VYIGGKDSMVKMAGRMVGRNEREECGCAGVVVRLEIGEMLLVKN